MITHIRMKNFKSWKDSGEVQLAPLTGFFGTNSSGKSSLLQMLLLLKQTAEHPNLEEVIFFGNEGSYVNLGDFREVIYGHNVRELLELGFGCSLYNPFTIEVFGRKFDGQNGYVPLQVDDFSFNTSIREMDQDLRVERILYSFEFDDFTEVVWENGSLYYKDLHRQSNRTRGGVLNCYGRSSLGDEILRKLSTAFEKMFSQVYYLGPNRTNPQRLYEWEGFHPESIGQWGDKMIDALLSARVRQLKTVENENGTPIEERISKWLQDMKLAHSFLLSWSENQGGRNYEVRIQKNPTSTEVTLADMGYGFSQFLPVLVFCYYVPEGSTLILEQPGIHLHPMVQSELADLLIEVVTKRNLQILVESHSEHLLTRLQLRIAEEEISADQTALYFCENENAISTITPLNVDELGNITNWPKNFFGNVRGDLTKMTREQIKRKQKVEG